MSNFIHSDLIEWNEKIRFNKLYTWKMSKKQQKFLIFYLEIQKKKKKIVFLEEWNFLGQFFNFLFIFMFISIVPIVEHFVHINQNWRILQMLDSIEFAAWIHCDIWCSCCSHSQRVAKEQRFMTYIERL